MRIHRGYIISTNPFSPTLYRVVTEGQGGKIPNVLVGSFTSIGTVVEIIDNYLDNRPEEGQTDGRKAPSKK